MILDGRDRYAAAKAVGHKFTSPTSFSGKAPLPKPKLG